MISSLVTGCSGSISGGSKKHFFSLSTRLLAPMDVLFLLLGLETKIPYFLQTSLTDFLSSTQSHYLRNQSPNIGSDEAKMSLEITSNLYLRVSLETAGKEAIHK